MAVQVRIVQDLSDMVMRYDFMHGIVPIGVVQIWELFMGQCHFQIAWRWRYCLWRWMRIFETKIDHGYLCHFECEYGNGHKEIRLLDINS